MLDFLHMGDYTFYVWASVGVVLAVMITLICRAKQQFKRVRDSLAWSQDVQP